MSIVDLKKKKKYKQIFDIFTRTRDERSVETTNVFVKMHLYSQKLWNSIY
jgi:hypothetical protein